mgnify:CR=1 FL=1
MSTTINASTSGGLIQTADTSGVLELQSNGSTKMTVTSTGVYGNLVSSIAQTASGTAVNFVDIPSWVKRITVMFNGVSTSGTSTVQVQIGGGGGVEAIGYVGATSQSPNGGAPSTLSLTSGFALDALGSAAYARTGKLDLVNLSGNAWVAGFSGYVASAISLSGGGSKSLSSTLDRIRITTVNGTDTFDAGTINIMYEG